MEAVLDGALSGLLSVLLVGFCVLANRQRSTIVHLRTDLALALGRAQHAENASARLGEVLDRTSLDVERLSYELIASERAATVADAWAEERERIMYDRDCLRDQAESRHLPDISAVRDAYGEWTVVTLPRQHRDGPCAECPLCLEEAEDDIIASEEN